MVQLAHSPAYILRQLLVDLGLASLPSDSSSWPVFTHNEPNTPDACITVKDTAGVKNSRNAIDGIVSEYFGCQIRLRHADPNSGDSKLRELQAALDEDVLDDVVIVTGPSGTATTSYLVHTVMRESATPLGKAPESNRWLFTLNVTLDLRQLS